jgi:hypothetical protein
MVEKLAVALSACRNPARARDSGGFAQVTDFLLAGLDDRVLCHFYPPAPACPSRKEKVLEVK